MTLPPNYPTAPPLPLTLGQEVTRARGGLLRARVRYDDAVQAIVLDLQVRIINPWLDRHGVSLEVGEAPKKLVLRHRESGDNVGHPHDAGVSWFDWSEPGRANQENAPADFQDILDLLRLKLDDADNGAYELWEDLQDYPARKTTGSNDLPTLDDVNDRLGAVEGSP